nr:sulfotransferase family 2 domain-containing protein [Azospirillum halopraeferens]
MLFLHIPKTAGISFYKTLQDVHGADNVWIPYKDEIGNAREIIQMDWAARARFKAIAGHMPFGGHGLFNDCVYATFIRHPIERVLSSYFFNHEREDSPTYKSDMAANVSITSFAQQHDNVMTRYLMTSHFTDATYWMSSEVVPDIAGRSFLGYDFRRPVEVRGFRLKQWSLGVTDVAGKGRRGLVSRVRVQASDDGFREHCVTIAKVTLANDGAANLYSVAPSRPARYWRLLADVNPQTARWGVMTLAFYDQPLDDEDKAMPPAPASVDGEAIASGWTGAYRPANAFDGYNVLAPWQRTPGSLTQAHCDEAIENLREWVVIGLVERYVESLDLMRAAFRWPRAPEHRVNTGTVRRHAGVFGPGVQRELEAINRYDVQVHRAAVTLFEQDLKHWALRRDDA